MSNANDKGPCLRITGVVTESRQWAPKDNPTEQKRTVTVAWMGGNQSITVDADNKAFAALGEGQPISLDVPFKKDDRRGWEPVRGVVPSIVKGGAA